jgi:predicted MFS family arabinose efflux permease
MNAYLGELRTEWRALTAAVIGLSSGLMMVSYVLGMIGPSLVAEFAWTKSQMAMVGTLSIGAIFVLPVVGRLTDITGVRKMAGIGVVAAPLLFIALTRVTTIAGYGALYFLIAAILVTTTPAVYCRTVVQYFVRARGLALGIAMAGPSLAVALGGPLVNNFIADHGWRAGCMLTAAITAIGGLAALILLPPERRGPDSRPASPGRTKDDYRQVLTSPAFWIIFIGIILSTMPNSIMVSQMNLILAENLAAGKDASIMISAYATGTIFGRLISGAALDRYSAPLVAAIGLAAAGLGVLLLASGFDTTPIVFLAVLIVGLSVGAEGDVIAYLVVRNFGVRLYSTVHSITSTGTAIASVIGALLLSYILKQYGQYAPFLTVCGVLAVVASVLFLFLPRNPQVEDEMPDRGLPEAKAAAA